MKNNISIKKILVVFITPILFIIACSTQRNLILDGKYVVNAVNISDVEIESTNLFIEDSSFIIDGVLKRTTLFGSIPGHVDIAIMSSGGTAIERVSVNNKLPFIGRSKRKSSKFKATFPMIPPEGSVISVGFHKNSLSNSQDTFFNCGENKAIMETSKTKK